MCHWCLYGYLPVHGGQASRIPEDHSREYGMGWRHGLRDPTEVQGNGNEPGVRRRGRRGGGVGMGKEGGQGR